MTLISFVHRQINALEFDNNRCDAHLNNLTHFDHPAKVNFKVRNLIVDYALAAAIVILLPIPNIGIFQAIALLLLNILLVIGIARLWNVQRRGGCLARIGILFGIAGSVLIGILSWVLMLALGGIIPWVGTLAPGLAVFCYFWGSGQAVHHYYVSKMLAKSDGAYSPREQDES